MENRVILHLLRRLFLTTTTFRMVVNCVKKKVAFIGIQRVSTITTMRFVMTMQPTLTWSMGNTV